MRDDPPAQAILAAAIDHLRATVLPTVSGRTAFDLRVALSALELIARELAAPEDGRERDDLRALLGADGDLDTLNRMLADHIETGEISTADPALIAHLRRTTLAKLAIDQPGYASYRRHIDAEERP